jgi:hypothetical protein
MKPPIFEPAKLDRKTSSSIINHLIFSQRKLGVFFNQKEAV